MKDKHECETEVIQPIPVTNESKRKRCLFLLLLLLLLASSAVIAGVLLGELEKYDSHINSRTSISTEIQKSTDPTSAYYYTSNTFEATSSKIDMTTAHVYSLNASIDQFETTTPKVDITTAHVSSLNASIDTFETTTPTVGMTMAPVSAQNVTIGSRGKAFIVVFMTNIETSTKNIYVTSEDVIQLNLSTSLHLYSSLKTQIDRSMEIQSHKKITLPRNIELIPFQKEFKAILITTSDDVFVISHDKAVPPGASVGSTTHIPLHKLSTKYIVISTQPRDSRKSQFAVAAIEENTIISVTFKMKNNNGLTVQGNYYYSGDVFNFTLDKLQTFEIVHSTDLSGTVIESSLPIAAFSGNDCNRLDRDGACDHLIEQLPPINSLDNTYIVPPNADHRDTKIRITAAENTSLIYQINGIPQTVALQKIESIDTIITSSQTCTIESTSPIIVTSFGLHYKALRMGDPSMTIVPGIHQYLNYYKIVVPNGYVHNYVSVMITLSSRSFFRVNGSAISERDVVFEKNVVMKNTVYNVRSIKVVEGELTASSDNGEPFGLMFAGTKKYEAYGFSGNSLLLSDIL